MTRDFHERFTLKVELAEAKLRFVNRALNEVFEVNRSFDFGLILRKAVATEMGVHFFQQSFGQFIESDFLKALRAIETINRVAYGEPNPFVDEKWKLKALIKKAVPELLDSAEVDLNVRWDGNRFWPAGAALLAGC
jgi:hypothetical protein